MNKALVGVLLIAVLIGLGGGYILGYTIYQPQLQTLQNDIDNLHDEMHDGFQLRDDYDSALNADLQALNSSLQSQITFIENRSWHEVWSSSGSANLTSGNFWLRGKMFQIGWVYSGLTADSWISASLRFSNGTIYWFNGASGIFGAFDSEGPTKQYGQYFVAVTVSDNVDWALAIYDFY